MVSRMSEDSSSNTAEFKAFVQRGGAEATSPSRTPFIAGAAVAALVVIAVVVYLLTR
jgi:hypothetical protein